MEKTAYLSEIRTPSIVISNPKDEKLASKEIDDYLKRLEVLRLEFIESLSSCREKVALAYISELHRTQEIHSRRLRGVFTFILKDTLPNNLRQRFLRGMDASIKKALEFAQTIAPQTFVAQNIIEPTIEPEEKELPIEPEKKEPKTESKFNKRLKDYGEFLTVKDLCEIFKSTPRTVSNWETKGLIVNVSATSSETNALGRKKRGAEKRYRKEAILKSVALQEKYNALI